jgi:hypothetical protein
MTWIEYMVREKKGARIGSSYAKVGFMDHETLSCLQKMWRLLRFVTNNVEQVSNIVGENGIRCLALKSRYMLLPFVTMFAIKEEFHPNFLFMKCYWLPCIKDKTKHNLKKTKKLKQQGI